MRSIPISKRHRRTAAAAFVVLGAIGAPLIGRSSAATTSTTTTSLSDMTITGTPVNGWGPVELNRSNGEQAASDGGTITINGRTWAKGLGVHATSDVRYSVPANCTFNSYIGIDDEVGSNGSVTFEVWSGTSKKLYASPVLTGASDARLVSVSLRNVSQLRLVVRTGSDDWYDHADWAGAQVSCPVTASTSSTTSTTAAPSTLSSSTGSSTTTSSTTTVPPTTTTTAAPTTTTTTTPPTASSQSGTPGSRVGFAVSYLPLWQPSADLTRDFDTMAATGAKWVRIDFPWSAVQDTGPNTWNWSAIDRAVDAARARGLQILATPAYTPGWARAAGTNSDKYPPVDNATYANFLRAAVARYSPLGVKAWEIWNEPNVASFWLPKPDPAAYVRLLKAGYQAVKSVDPTATVVSAGVAHAGGTLDSQASDGSWLSPYRYVSQMYAAGAAGSFDALGLHPYAAFPYAPSSDKSWNTFQQTDDIYALMSANGDGSRKIWATEAGYHTGTSYESLTEDQQASYTREYLDLWDNWSFTGPFFLYMPRDRSADLSASEENFGVLLRNDFTRKPAFTAVDNFVN